MKKRGQIWIETLIYTLIALVMIGLVLTFAKPKIEEYQDNSIIEQTIGVLEEINSIILSLEQGGAGNKRVIDLGIKKGVLEIDGASDIIYFEMDSKSIYSQPGDYIHYGDIIVYTEKKGEFNHVTLISNYSDRYDITYKGENSNKSITKAPSSYKLSLSNNGKNQDKTIIDIEV